MNWSDKALCRVYGLHETRLDTRTREEKNTHKERQISSEISK